MSPAALSAARLPLLLAIAISPLACFSQTATPVSTLLDQLRSTQRVGDVALSPDGSTVAMELAGNLTVAPVSDPGQGHILPVCKDGSGEVSSLSWSPNGAELGILADCDEGPEVLLAKMHEGKPEGKPHVLATLHGFAKELSWAPDGRSLALLYVEGATRPSGALAAEKPRTGVIGVEGLEVQRVASIDAASGKVAELTPATLHVFEFDYSPDAEKLAYVAASPPGENNWWIAKLYTQDIASGSTPTVLLDPKTVSGPLHGLQIAVPRWSPDGSKIAFIGGLMSDQGITGGDIYLLPANGSSGPVDFTPNSTTTTEWIHWLPSGKLLGTEFSGGSQQIDLLHFTFPPGFHAPDGTHVGVANRLTGEVLQKLPYTIGDGRLLSSFAVSADGKTAAWHASNFSQAAEVYAGPLGSTPLPAITHINDALKPSWGKAESLRWTNEGFHIQGWLLYPANYDPSKKYGLIVMVHGGPSYSITPGWPYAGFGAAPLAAAGYFVLQPNPRGSYGQGETFTQANRKDFGYGDLRDILAGVDAVEKQIPAVDDKRLGLTGWSYGGFMTMFGVTQTHRFKAAVAGAGISDWLSYYGENQIDQWMTPFFGASVYNDPAVYAKSSAIHFIKNVNTPTLIVVGDRDGECPAPQSFEFWHALKAFHVPTTLVVYADEGHGFSKPADQQNVLERSIAWFDQYLK
jgi:dipeptidyl aminopeptidase/acylaminoacyl peptidase